MDLTPIPTMAIAADNEEGWMLINADEFDPNIHKLYEPEAEKPSTRKKQTDKAE